MTAPTPNSTASKRQHAVTVTGVPDQWAKCTGGVPSVDVSENWNGGATVADLTMGRVKYSNATTSRPFNQVRDRPVERFLRSVLGTGWSTTIIDQDLDANGVAVGEPRVLTGCVPVTITPPEYDTTSSDGGEFSVEWKVQSVQ